MVDRAGGEMLVLFSERDMGGPATDLGKAREKLLACRFSAV